MFYLQHQYSEIKVINKNSQPSGEKFPPNVGYKYLDETSHDMAIVILQVRYDALRDGKLFFVTKYRK